MSGLAWEREGYKNKIGPTSSMGNGSEKDLAVIFGHSEEVVPMISRIMEGGYEDGICFYGPGLHLVSTDVRT